MNTKSTPTTRTAPTEDDIRAYAYHLYVQSGCLPGRDLENWLEAKRCLEANLAVPGNKDGPAPPAAEAHRFTMPASDASIWIERSACVEPCEPTPRRSASRRRR